MNPIDNTLMKQPCHTKNLLHLSDAAPGKIQTLASGKDNIELVVPVAVEPR
jgi:hypothetical protein